MPLPVAVTSMSLQRPSLEASIIQRTVSLPICCATSITHFLSPLLTSSASLIAGRFSSSNATSTTGPITCIVCPLLLILSPIRRIISFVSSSDGILTSVISCVIEACLALLYCISRSCSISFALFDAACIAIIRAFCSQENDSTKAPYTKPTI